MRSNLYDPKDPHNIAIPGPRSLNEVYSAVLEAKDAELALLKVENTDLIARLERAEKALEQAGGTLLKVLESDKTPYMVSFKAQYKDIRKLDAPELAAWLKERR